MVKKCSRSCLPYPWTTNFCKVQHWNFNSFQSSIQSKILPNIYLLEHRSIRMLNTATWEAVYKIISFTITYHLLFKQRTEIKALRSWNKLKSIHSQWCRRPFFPSLNNKIRGVLCLWKSTWALSLLNNQMFIKQESTHKFKILADPFRRNKYTYSRFTKNSIHIIKTNICLLKNGWTIPFLEPFILNDLRNCDALSSNDKFPSKLWKWMRS